MKLASPLALGALLALGLAWRPAEGSLPDGVRAGSYQLKEVGKGRLTWLGFGIYEASLWTPDGHFDATDAGETVALALWYERRFSRDELIDITRGEWERLALAPDAARRGWSRQLQAIWKDVERGDNLTAVVLPQGETRFYDRHGLLGSVDDPAFGPAFLAIWLDSRSAVRDLRTRLLGGGERR